MGNLLSAFGSWKHFIITPKWGTHLKKERKRMQQENNQRHNNTVKSTPFIQNSEMYTHTHTPPPPPPPHTHIVTYTTHTMPKLFGGGGGEKKKIGTKTDQILCKKMGFQTT